MKTARKLFGTAMFIGVTLAGQGAWACAACLGQSDSPMAQGMNAGIFVMLGLIGSVLSGAVTFFVVLARRSAAVAKAHKDADHLA